MELSELFKIMGEADEIYDTMEPHVETDPEKNYEWGMCYHEDLR